jgi:hypothetical protein
MSCTTTPRTDRPQLSEEELVRRFMDEFDAEELPPEKEKEES